MKKMSYVINYTKDDILFKADGAAPIFETRIEAEKYIESVLPEDAGKVAVIPYCDTCKNQRYTGEGDACSECTEPSGETETEKFTAAIFEHEFTPTNSFFYVLASGLEVSISWSMTRQRYVIRFASDQVGAMCEVVSKTAAVNMIRLLLAQVEKC